LVVFFVIFVDLRAFAVGHGVSVQSSISHRTLLRPRSVRDALAMLRDEGTLTPMAGCTDLYVALNFGTLKETRFLDLWRLDDLRTIEVRGGVLSVGALATYTDLISSSLVRKRLPMLVAAAREVGGVQIQNRGTIGGNVANGSPAGDTLPVLAATDAVVVLQHAGGIRRVPFTSFYSGYRQAVRRADELIVAFEIPRTEGVQYFRKVGTRAAQAISKIVMAGVLVRGGRSGRTARIALGSVAPTVMRVPRTEAAFAEGAPIDVLQRTLMDEIVPIDDVRSTAEYRRRVAANLLARFVGGASRR
jgi:CO/xanthine dehydrogenase FAD-binding subunit